jgi:hypothetical protein
MIKIGARCAHWSASAILATLGVECRSSVPLMSAYLFLGNPFSGSLTGSRQHGLGYLQGAAGCWWLAAGVIHALRQLYAPWQLMPQGLPLRRVLAHLCRPLSHDGPLLSHLLLLKSGQSVFPSRSESAAAPHLCFDELPGEDCCCPCDCLLGGVDASWVGAGRWFVALWCC